jgi:cytochrome oxidase assembly protein ShyY1
VLVLAAVIAAAVLGYWQLDAWQQRREAEARDLTNVEPVPLADVMGPDDPFPGDKVGQPVTVSGTWTGPTVYIEGREHEGVQGLWRVDILRLGDGAAIPVVRGWLESRPHRMSTLPDVDPVGLVGWLQPSEGTGDTDDDPTDDTYPQLRVADLVQLVDADLYSGYVVAKDGIDGMPPADLAALPEAGRFTALRNLLYGVEWWVFGGFAVFLWWRWVRDETRPAEPAGRPVDTVSP